MKAALYIHVPFCIQKCYYCDFYSIKAEAHLIDNFIKAAKIEIELYSKHPIFSNIEFDTIYLGGGTPSLFSASQISDLFQHAQNIFHFNENLEFTLEANPETLSISKLKDYYSAGINRISIGVQSFSNSELQLLGRFHNADQARECISWAKQTGFDNISLDLIFAIPGQSLTEWQVNLNEAIHYKPEHISIYGLTIEPGTRLESEISSGKLSKVSEETEAEMYLSAVKILANHGYQQYEISNFSLPDFQSKHNSMYWNGSPYLGIGPSAHSFWQSRRQWNINSIDQYLNLIYNKQKPIGGFEKLSNEQKMMEFIYLNLRTVQGLEMKQFKNEFHLDFGIKFQNVLNKMADYSNSKLYNFEHERFKLTTRGFILFDEICQQFADAV